MKTNKELGLNRLNFKFSLLAKRMRKRFCRGQGYCEAYLEMSVDGVTVVFNHFLADGALEGSRLRLTPSIPRKNKSVPSKNSYWKLCFSQYFNARGQCCGYGFMEWKMKFIVCFLILCHFCPPGSGSGLQIRIQGSHWIRIHNIIGWGIEKFSLISYATQKQQPAQVSSS
jgi:hypothetical protein